MSYILEALKKSEQEREREKGGLPDIKSIHTPSISHQSEGAKWWLIVLIALLVISAAIVSVVYLKFMKPAVNQTEIAQQNSVEAEVSNTQAKVTESKSLPKPKPGRDEKAGETAAAKVEQKDSRVVFSKQQLQRDDVIGNIDEQRKQARLDQTKKQNARQPGVVVQDDAIPIADIPDEVRKRIPRIAFEGHVYSSTPSRRSVMINGHKMREGDAIGEDLMLRKITPEGAEFEYKGYIFKLGALQDWSFN